MALAVLQDSTELMLEWVSLLSLAASALCLLALAVLFFVGRRQHALRQRAKRRRRALLRTDLRELQARRWRTVKSRKL